jgi:hypothetical protein
LSRIVEKFTRKGNEIRYEVTVEDPEVLVKPWVMPSRTLRLSTGKYGDPRAWQLHGKRA